jgi:hypothetical protein
MKLPQSLDRDRHVDLHGRNLEPWIRTAVLLIFVGISAAGLANVFGQRTGATTVESSAARMTLEAPGAARGGLMYQARFQIEARRDLEKPMLVFDPGWFEGFTINTFEPDPVEWEHRNGRNVMLFGRVPAGEKLVFRLQFQVNPTAVGGRHQGVALEDGGEPLLRLVHRMRLFP